MIFFCKQIANLKTNTSTTYMNSEFQKLLDALLISPENSIFPELNFLLDIAVSNHNKINTKIIKNSYFFVTSYIGNNKAERKIKSFLTKKIGNFSFYIHEEDLKDFLEKFDLKNKTKKTLYETKGITITKVGEISEQSHWIYQLGYRKPIFDSNKSFISRILAVNFLIRHLQKTGGFLDKLHEIDITKLTAFQNLKEAYNKFGEVEIITIKESSNTLENIKQLESQTIPEKFEKMKVKIHGKETQISSAEVLARRILSKASLLLFLEIYQNKNVSDLFYSRSFQFLAYSFGTEDLFQKKQDNLEKDTIGTIEVYLNDEFAGSSTIIERNFEDMFGKVKSKKIFDKNMKIELVLKENSSKINKKSFSIEEIKTQDTIEEFLTRIFIECFASISSIVKKAKKIIKFISESENLIIKISENNYLVSTEKKREFLKLIEEIIEIIAVRMVRIALLENLSGKLQLSNSDLSVYLKFIDNITKNSV